RAAEAAGAIAGARFVGGEEVIAGGEAALDARARAQEPDIHERSAVVAVLAELLRERRDRGRELVAADGGGEGAVRLRPHAGHERDVRGQGLRLRSERLLEQDAVPCEAIDPRAGGAVIPVAAEALRAQRIDRDQDDRKAGPAPAGKERSKQ